MADPTISPASLIFWCWHAFIDDIYDDWLSCRVLAAGDPTGYVGFGAAARVVCRGIDNHVHEIWASDTWYHFDMTGVTGVDAAGDPMGYVDSNGTARVIYRGVDNHIWEMALSPDGWQPFDMTAGARKD